MAKEAVNDHGVKLSDIEVGDTIRFVVGKDGVYSRSKEGTAKVLAVGVKRVKLRSSGSYSGAKYGIGEGTGNWLVIGSASEDSDYRARVWEKYGPDYNRAFRTVEGQWLLNLSRVTLVGDDQIEAQIEEEIERALRGAERRQEWADEEAAREAVVDDIVRIIEEATGQTGLSAFGRVDSKNNKITLSVEDFAAIISRTEGDAIIQKQADTIEEAKTQRAGAKAKLRVNPGGDYQQAVDVKVRWTESGTVLERV